MKLLISAIFEISAKPNMMISALLRKIFIILMLCILVQPSVRAQSTAEIQHPKSNNFVKNINGYSIVYDCYDCKTSTTDKVIVYAKKGNKRMKLVTEDYLDASHFDDITIKFFLNQPFIYITSSNGYGNFIGNMYALDINHLKAKSVNLGKGCRVKIPDNLEFRKQNGIRIEKKDRIFSGAYYKSPTGENYTYDCEYKMVKLGNNFYKLMPAKGSLVAED